MLFYIIFSIIIAIFNFIASMASNRNIRKSLLFLMFLSTFFLSAFRVDIGIDYSGHYYLYKLIVFNGDYGVSEPLFILISLFCNSVGIDFPGVIIIYSFITIYPIYYISQKEDNPYLFFLYFLIFYFISFAIIRQFAAISICILGVYYFLKFQKKKTTILLFIFSILIHTSSALFILAFYFSLNIKPNFKTTIFISFLLIILGRSLLHYIYLSSEYIDFLGYSHYLDADNINNQPITLNSGYGVLLRYIGYFSILIISNMYMEKSKPLYVFNTLFLCLIFSDLLSISIQIFLRLRFIFYCVCIFPFFYIKPSRLKKKYVMNTILLFILIIFSLFIPSINVSWNNIPYQSILYK